MRGAPRSGPSPRRPTFQFPETVGERPKGSAQRGLYLLALNEIAVEDVEVNRTLVEVFQLVRPLSDLDLEPLLSRGHARMKVIEERLAKARAEAGTAPA